MANHNPNQDIEDFFNVRKEWKRIPVRPGASELRRMQERKEQQQPGPPPDTNTDLQDCTEDQWKAYIKEQEAKLRQRASVPVYESQMASSVFSSNMDGVESCARVTGAGSIVSRRGAPRAMCQDFEMEYSWKVPIIEFKDQIEDIVKGNQIVVLSGPTGCGKSTQVPQYILSQHVREKKHVNIVVTQPRKLAASSLAKRVCQERNFQLGGLVGYQVGLDKANKSADTRLLYVTTGVLKRMIIGSKNLHEWTHIILDEVHERDLDMDLLLILCKKFLFTNSRDTKLILMSATLNEQKLRSYFSSKVPGLLNSPAPFLDVGHKKKINNATIFYYEDLIETHRLQNLPVPEFNPQSPLLHPTCIKLAKTLLINLDQMELEAVEKKKPGAVLVFLPGINEIQEVRNQLLDQAGGEGSRKLLEWKIIPLHSSISWEEHQRIYDEAPPRTRKIILATNIAESSLTIPDIRYVIDFALTKNLQADPETNYPRLMLEWVCRNQIVQRSGRAGRVHHDGRVYVLIPESMVESLPKEHVPEMRRVPLSKVVLDVKTLDMGSPKEILALAMDPPAIHSLLKSIVSLQEMNAMKLTVKGIKTRDDGDLTVLGEIIAKLPIDVKLGKLIFLGHIFGVLEEAVIIACGLNGKSIFTAPFDKKIQAYKNKLFWADRTFNDCYAILNAFQAWKTRKDRGDFSGSGGVREEKQYCRVSFLQRNQLQEMLKLTEEVTKTLRLLQIEPVRVQQPVSWTEDSRDLVLQVVMFGAFYPNYFVKMASADLCSQANKTLFGKDPRNTVYLTGMKEDQGQFGELYAGQLKKIFEDCTKDEEKVHLTFRGSKILVEFDLCGAQLDRWVEDSGQKADQAENMTGEILHQVYIATKLKNLGRFNKPSIRLYNLEDAEKIHQEWRKAVTNAEMEEGTSKIQQMAPPPMGEQEISIKKVAHVSSPSMFWVYYGESLEQLERITRITGQVLEKCQPVRGGVKVGQYFLAPVARGAGEQYQRYARVKVTSLKESSKVTAFFIDHGFTELMSVTRLRRMPTDVVRKFSDLVTIPGLAVECSLSGLQPNKTRNVKGFWDEEVISRFKELTVGRHGGVIIGKIFSVTKSASGNGFVINLKGLKVSKMTKMEMEMEDVVKVLLTEKLACEAMESLTSQEDHKARQDYCAGTVSIQRYMESQYLQAFEVKPELKVKEDVGKLKERVELSGPFSPLEHKVMAQYRSGLSKGAKVDQESVNCVMLNKEVTETDSWMVAAHVGMASNGESLSLSNTFWLSSKPGLGELLTMVFAPAVELRLKEGDRTHRRKMTGFIAGMGPKIHWNKNSVTKAEATEALYPEHDLEVSFKVNVDNEDIQNVNELRYCLNSMLCKSPDGLMTVTQTKALYTTQRKIQTCLKSLLERQRRMVPHTVSDHNLVNRWNIQQPDLVMDDKPVDLGAGFWVYDWIKGLRPEESRDKKRENQDQVDMLQKLHKIADMMSVVGLTYEETCPICPSQVVLQTKRQVYLHLNSEEHKIREGIVKGSDTTSRNY